MCMGSAAATLAALGGLTPNLTQVFGGVSMSEFPLDAGPFEVPQTEWKPRAHGT